MSLLQSNFIHKIREKKYMNQNDRIMNTMMPPCGS